MLRIMSKAVSQRCIVFDPNPVTFWQFVTTLVPTYVIMSLFGLYILRAILNGECGLLMGALMMGLLGNVTQPEVQTINVMALEKLGMPLYLLLVLTNLVLWGIGVALGVGVFCKVHNFYHDWLSSRRTRGSLMR